ncbi:hypothetical protein RCL1_002477 [Eukaryota sp. TZLM3-RCL]
MTTRYDRQSLLPEVTQSLLSDSSVLVVGAGGLGSCLLLHLAGAGVASGCGKLHIIDSDTVAIDNLHRQVIHSSDNVDVNKAVSAASAVSSLNPEVSVSFSSTTLSIHNVLEVIRGYDLVIDCTDNLPTKVLLNDSCMSLGINFLTASVVRWHGQVNYFPGNGSFGCYRCIFGNLPSSSIVKSAKQVGVMGPVVGTIACWQCTEAIKILLKRPHNELLCGKMLSLDLKNNKIRTINLKPKNSECRSCGVNKDHVSELNNNLWNNDRPNTQF